MRPCTQWTPERGESRSPEPSHGCAMLLDDSGPYIGLQLYTLREQCDLDLEQTLRRVGSLGYDGVELFQLHGFDPEQVRMWLDEAGLVAVGRHAPLDVLQHNMPLLGAELAILGTNRIVLPWIEPSGDSVDQIKAVARAAQNAGLRLGFHNHWLELAPFENDRTFLDLLRDLPEELLWFELDLGWIWHAGVDPVFEIRKTSGRCPLVHVKDFRDREGTDDVPVGDGAVGYDRVLPAALRGGVEWLIVEEDDVAEPVFEQVERSLRAVRQVVANAA
jgi:sugar phosphate isomerase/epimerase